MTELGQLHQRPQILTFVAMPVLAVFDQVCKSYDGIVQIVDHLDLAIQEGEFLSLLGPSGSGKTTTLMMLAGFETPTSGDIRLGERSLRAVPAHQRDIGMVFQNYALFPHMTVGENIAFPLQVRGVGTGGTAKAGDERTGHGAVVSRRTPAAGAVVWRPAATRCGGSSLGI